ncbi:MAG: hypothetical protein HYY16_00360 [Planctomycetes bacterium]|nr:hypothetical protein [Planctomycetota bacterium]
MVAFGLFFLTLRDLNLGSALDLLPFSLVGGIVCFWGAVRCWGESEALLLDRSRGYPGMLVHLKTSFGRLERKEFPVAAIGELMLKEWESGRSTLHVSSREGTPASWVLNLDSRPQVRQMIRALTDLTGVPASICQWVPCTDHLDCTHGAYHETRG